MDYRQTINTLLTEEVKGKVRDMVRTNPQAAIGAGVTAAVGAAFGGPVGAALGGAIGGWFGSFLDRKKNDTK